MVKRVGRYNIQSTLGQGTFGKYVRLVLLARHGLLLHPIALTLVAVANTMRCLSVSLSQGEASYKRRHWRTSGHQDLGQGEDPETKHGITGVLLCCVEAVAARFACLLIA